MVICDDVTMCLNQLAWKALLLTKLAIFSISAYYILL